MGLQMGIRLSCYGGRVRLDRYDAFYIAHTLTYILALFDTQLYSTDGLISRIFEAIMILPAVFGLWMFLLLTRVDLPQPPSTP